MRPGPLIRRLFGPFEHSVAETYRRIFINLDDLAGLMSAWVPDAQNILEVGCGEGAMTERIVRVYPSAKVTAIDISPNVGRLLRGNPSAVTFSQEAVQQVADKQPGVFDLVVLSDVLHHVPPELRHTLLLAIARAMTPKGYLLVKDWIISRSPIHWLCEASDRYLTGDDVAYFTVVSLNALLSEIFPHAVIRQTSTVKPWRNNLAVLLQG